MKKNIFLLLLIIMSTTTIFSYEWHINAHVLLVEPTYMPGLITFKIDKTITDSHNNQIDGSLRWSHPDEMNMKAVYATLLSAVLTGKSVNLYGTGNEVEFIHILNN